MHILCAINSLCSFRERFCHIMLNGWSRNYLLIHAISVPLNKDSFLIPLFPPLIGNACNWLWERTIKAKRIKFPGCIVLHIVVPVGESRAFCVGFLMMEFDSLFRTMLCSFPALLLHYPYRIPYCLNCLQMIDELL